MQLNKLMFYLDLDLWVTCLLLTHETKLDSGIHNTHGVLISWQCVMNKMTGQTLLPLGSGVIKMNSDKAWHVAEILCYVWILNVSRFSESALFMSLHLHCRKAMTVTALEWHFLPLVCCDIPVEETAGWQFSFSVRCLRNYWIFL